MRNIIIALFFVGAMFFLFGAYVSYKSYATALSYVPRHSYAVQIARMLGVSGVLLTLSLALLLGGKKRLPRRLSPGPLPADSSKDLTVGREFNENSLGRQRVNFYASQPDILRGRIRDMRGWVDKKAFSTRKIIAFHLDYNRQATDFGDILVKLNDIAFKRFQFEEGDDIQISLQWRGGSKPVALIGEMRNISSGQRFDAPMVGEKYGAVEPLEPMGDERNR